jgi:hypothetical protein
MALDEEVVRVKQYVKVVPGRDPITNEPVRQKVVLDWGIGTVGNPNDGVYVYGSPSQGHDSSQGRDPINDNLVLFTEEVMPFSDRDNLPADDSESPANGSLLHFKNPLV